MKLAIVYVFGLTALVLGLSSSVEAQFFDVQVSAGNHDNYVVVERERGTIIIEEPAPRVVVVKAPPLPQRPVVVRPEPPRVGAIWVEGYWRYTGVRFVWVRGHWIPPRYGYRFVQPRWHVHAGYHYYTPGYFRPRHTTVRRQPYYRYRPRPGYVYYRGQQRPYYRDHHRYGDYERHENPNHGHYRSDVSRANRPKPHEARGRERGQAHARSPQRGKAQPVQRPTARPQSRPAVPRGRVHGSRGARPSKGHQVAAVRRR